MVEIDRTPVYVGGALSGMTHFFTILHFST
jgi:hypothetical protein